MIEDIKKERSRVWGRFVSRHWNMIMLWIVLGTLAVAAAVFVFVDFTGDAQTSGMVPESLGNWSVGHIVKFVLNLLFWELLFIGIPVIIGVIIMYALWWDRLPPRERAEYERAKLFKSSDESKGSGAIWLFIQILFIFKIWNDGNWNVPISTWDLNYVIGSFLWVLVVIALVAGVPIAIGGMWYLNHIRKKAEREDGGQSPPVHGPKEPVPDPVSPCGQ